MTPRQKLILESTASLAVAMFSLALYVVRVVSTRQPVAEDDVYYATGFIAGVYNAMKTSRQAGAIIRQERLPYQIVIERPAMPPMTAQNNDTRLDVMVAQPTPLPPLLRDANGGLRLWVDRVAQPQREGVAL